MDIAEARRAIHQWRDVFAPGVSVMNAQKPPSSCRLPQALPGLRQVRRRPIHAPAILEHRMTTRVGVQWVMPVVPGAETRDKQLSLGSHVHDSRA